MPAPKRVREAPPQDRITQSAWFERKHRDIEPAVWEARFHRQPRQLHGVPHPADQGDFDDDRVRIPVSTRMTSNSLPHNAPPAPSGSAPSVPSSATTPRPATRRVVDAATRTLHWLMALSFTGAYITADGERWRLVHVTLGYTLAGLLVARVLWGLFGPGRCACPCCGASCRLPAWLQSLVAVRSPSAMQAAWRPGANLLMALAVGLILVSIVPLTLSGYAVWDEWGGEWLEEVHEFFGNAMLMMVVLVHGG